MGRCDSAPTAYSRSSTGDGPLSFLQERRAGIMAAPAQRRRSANRAVEASTFTQT